MNDNKSPLPFRPCVGIALFNAKGQVFVGERLDNRGAWQMPQGGIDPGEGVEQAFFRELREEVGTTRAQVLRIMDRPLRYHLPDHLIGKLWGGRFGGQEQTWVAARFTGVDSDINITAHDPPEFSQWKWIDLVDVTKFAVPFKRATYDEVIKTFRDLT